MATNAAQTSYVLALPINDNHRTRVLPWEASASASEAVQCSNWEGLSWVRGYSASSGGRSADEGGSTALTLTATKSMARVP